MNAKALQQIATYAAALDAADKEIFGDRIGEDDDVYVQFVPVYWYQEVIGFLSDEVGGSYGFYPITEKEREWWAARPK